MPCISAEQIPKMPATAMRPEQDVNQLAAAAALDIDALQEHSERLEALLRACASQQKEKP